MEGELRSFIVARDPSLISFNRPGMFNLKKNLEKAMTTTFLHSSSETSEPEEIEKQLLNVYLRVKNEEIDSLYEIDGNNFIFRKADHVKKCSFSKIFGPEVSQTDIFNYVVKAKLLAFISGQNTSLFTYGASGSGKTFTIFGTPEEPGLIPRSLEYIFKSTSKFNTISTIKPLPDGNIEKLDDEQFDKMHHLKSYIISNGPIDQESHIKTYTQIQEQLASMSIAEIDENEDIALSFWVSFSEIYNENIYDLLAPPPPKGKGRCKLVLGRSTENIFIRNLTMINVKNGLEAYQILQFGLNNLNYASTAVNTHSSRSHCIFSIKLVQTSRKKKDVFISNFNFCDLAGAERLKKTKNCGDRLKESNNINTSIMVLGRCIETIRQCQKMNDKNRLIPFRESKLTHIFQKALLGHERLEMIINISPLKSMVDETINVLNFSAVAKTIYIEEPQIIRKKAGFSLLIDEDTILNDLRKDSELEKLRKENKRLKEKIKVHELDAAAEYEQIHELLIQVIDERDSIIERHEQEIGAVREHVIKQYKDLLKIRSEHHEEEIRRLKEEQKEEEMIYISSSSSDDEDTSPNEKLRKKSIKNDECFCHQCDIYKEENLKLKEELSNLYEEKKRYREAYKDATKKHLRNTENFDDIIFTISPRKS